MQAPKAQEIPLDVSWRLPRWIACKVKRDPASVPFESRILSASMEAH